MRDEKRAQNAPETIDKDTNNFANEQVKNLPFQVGEVVRVKKDGAELPIEKIVFDELDPELVYYVVGGMYELEGNIEKLQSPGDTASASSNGPGSPADVLQDREVPESNGPQFDFSSIDNPVAPPEDVKELPTWGLPEDLQNVIDDVSKGYRSHRDFVVSSLMCATACVVGKRVTAHYDNYTNHATLWLMTVADSSRGKSKPLKFFFKPIQEMENDAYMTYKQAIKEWRANKCEGEEPIYHRRLIGNATDEVVLKALTEVEDLCWYNDEMRATIESWGLYKNGANGVLVSILMSIFDNEPTSIDRMSRDSSRAEHPNLSMVGTTQPSVLKQMMGKKGYDKDGMFQRFLYSFPERKKRPARIKHIMGDRSKILWHKYVKQLCSCSFPDLYETQVAQKMHDDILVKWDAQADEYEEHGMIAMGSYVDKLNYQLCRWSACVAVLRGDQSIGADVMKYSIECMEYFKWCAERAYCVIVNDEGVQREPTRAEVFKLLQKWYGDTLNQTKLADALGMSQQAISKFLKAN